MEKEILKSKMMLIALASVLFVSCGGGGGSSNLPVKPGTSPSIPSVTPGSNPSVPSVTPEITPSTSTTITSENPLDSRKSNMTQLKSELNSNRVNSSATIPTDTGT